MDKQLSKAAIRRHIKSNGCDVFSDGCLYCKADNELGMTIEYGDFSPVECGDIEQTATCLKCGRKWIDVFSLTEVREISQGVAIMKKDPFGDGVPVRIKSGHPHAGKQGIILGKIHTSVAFPNWRKWKVRLSDFQECFADEAELDRME